MPTKAVRRRRRAADAIVSCQKLQKEQLMDNVQPKINVVLYFAIVFFLILVLIEYICIYVLNNGLLVYTLDDPYIHLALAENIIRGHYGINMSEFSAPSSSILWPFILAPFSSFSSSAFFINLASAIAAIIVLVKLLNISNCMSNDRARNIFHSSIMIFFIISTNMIGLVFTGMEHSLQLLVVLIIAYGMAIEIQKDKIEWWLWAAIVIAPLIRYECMAISLASLFYFVMSGRVKPAGLAFLAIIAFLGSFSLFLMSLGLDAFPSSIIAKSSVVRSHGALGSFIGNLINSYHNRQGFVLANGALILVGYVLFGDEIKRKRLACATVCAVFMHFVAGRYGWYHRYEIYILAFEVAVILYLYLPSICKKIFSSNKINRNLYAAITLAGGVSFLIGGPYIVDLFTIPIASNNIYEQQYQMHRFVVTYYKKPVAVNDLGYVSYKNSNYVLDLWGLGSQKALKYRMKSNNFNWMQSLVDEAGVGLVMIYDKWFSNIPKKWIKVGVLYLGKKRITPASSMVSFYATSPEAYPDIMRKLKLFSKTLPADVRFEFKEKNY